jgi:transcriptional regulator with PAS, ATPase and Fis domain
MIRQKRECCLYALIGFIFLERGRMMAVYKIRQFKTNFVCVNHPLTIQEALRQIRGIEDWLLVFLQDDIVAGVCSPQKLLSLLSGEHLNLEFDTNFAVIDSEQLLTENMLEFNYLIIQRDGEEIIGWIDSCSAEIQYLQQRLSEDVRELTTDLEAIVDSVYDEILVVDARGTVIRMSMRSAHNFWGIDAGKAVGMNILDLEKKGWFKPSVTRKVLEEQKKISVIQENRFGRTILAVGNPIFNRKKQLERIVIASRDITEVSQLEMELKLAKQQTKKYKQEIDSLRKYDFIGEKQIIYKSTKMKDLMRKVEHIAGVESTVTIYGESGVGKELIVQAIHHFSKRTTGPFVKINCSSIPGNLLESELFGYEKGAFTGALGRGKKGFFEIAHTGTIFLDEIAEIPVDLQAKLLRVIQEREVVRVGGTEVVHVDVRIIAATHRNLEGMVQAGTFREDLYYRLHVVPLYVPALRERIEDIEPLVYYFVDYFNKKYSLNMHFSEDAMEMMNAYDWPGNVRQLQNVVERSMVISSLPLITANELASFLPGRKTNVPPVQVHSIVPLQRAIDSVETQLIQMALAKYKTISKVAEVLGVSQPTLSRRYQKLKNRELFTIE